MLLLLVGGLSAGPALAQARAGAAPGKTQAARTAEDRFLPPPSLRPGWYARLETTFGRIIIRLLPSQAPRSVAYFAALAEGTIEWTDSITGEVQTDPYYDGILVTKVLDARRFEAGDVRTDGKFAPTFFIPMEGGGPINFMKSYRAGMMVSGSGHQQGVSFFLTSSPDPMLSSQHPCFGEVVRGQRIIDQITGVRAYNNDRPVEDVVIEKVRLFKVGDVPPLPEPVAYFPQPEQLRMSDRVAKEKAERESRRPGTKREGSR